MRRPQTNLNEAIAAICEEWWADLADVDLKTSKEGPNPNRAALAQLRRLSTIESDDGEMVDVSVALGDKGFPTYVDLYRRLQGLLTKWPGAGHLTRFASRSDFAEAVAVVAATLARVRENDTRSVARQLGAKSRDEAPLMAEARFKRLIRTTTAADLLDQGRRTVMLLGRTVSVGDLGASLLLWNVDPYAKRRWSFAYYGVDDRRADDPEDNGTTSEAAASTAA